MGHVRPSRLQTEVETESLQIAKEAMSSVPELKTRFESDAFSFDLRKVAQLISARGWLGSPRQIFFIQFEGWDHHHRLRESQAVLVPMLNRGLAAFRNALIELDVFDHVTTFTISEFGRSLEPNGTGSDHGWGGHHIVMGGAVRGGRVYGRYPQLAGKAALDVGGGSFVPTTSSDEYLAEMGLLLGTPASDLPHVLPNVANFWLASSRTPPLGMLT